MNNKEVEEKANLIAAIMLDYQSSEVKIGLDYKEFIKAHSERLAEIYDNHIGETQVDFWIKKHKENIKIIDEKDKEIIQLVKNNNDLKDRCEKLELQGQKAKALLIDCKNILQQCESVSIGRANINLKIIQINEYLQSLKQQP